LVVIPTYPWADLILDSESPDMSSNV
jgi:hypothetical protein